MILSKNGRACYAIIIVTQIAYHGGGEKIIDPLTTRNFYNSREDFNSICNRIEVFISFRLRTNPSIHNPISTYTSCKGTTHAPMREDRYRTTSAMHTKRCCCSVGPLASIRVLRPLIAPLLHADERIYDLLEAPSKTLSSGSQLARGNR